MVPRARQNFVKEENGKLKVYVTSPAVEGAANKAVLTALAEFLGVKTRQIEMIKGLKSKNKTIIIKDL